MTSHTTSQLPPGPPIKGWGLNYLNAMREDYLGFVSQLHRQHADIAHLKVVNEHITHVFHPDWVREVLVDQADALIRWERATHVFSLAMGQSVLVTEGAQWQRQRRMLQPGFAPKRVAGYAALMTQATQEALDTLAMTPSLQNIDIEAMMTRVTLDVILRTLFGQHQVRDARPVAQAIHTLSHYGIKQLFQPFSWPMWMPLPSVRRARDALETLNLLIAQHIHTQKTNADGDDLLTMLRTARDPDHPERGLSAQELHDQTMVMFQAGHETTATALTWWCGLIAQHPNVAQHIHQEVDAVLQGQKPTPEMLTHMPWLQASLKESMRLYPPAAILFTRRTCKDVTIGPWRLPKGHLIALTPYVIQRDARWFESPEIFRPERFLPDAPDTPRGAWFPFGTGPRVCVGQHFAMLEMGLIAAMLMQRFKLHWPQNAAWPASDLAVTLRPATAITLDLELRAISRAR
jgi:cytochrome P450